jgi:hypothetical protein
MGVLVPMAVDQFLKTRTMDKGNARIITTTINALNINRKSSIIVDAQSVKNTATAENKGYDAGKKISGIKRHLAVDINGFPQARFKMS